MKVFKLFSDCIPVKGIIRSIIYDLTRKKYYFIPNDLLLILEKFDGLKLDAIYKKYPKSDHSVIDEYFDFLNENQLIFHVDSSISNLFPPINLNWETPSYFTNCIINVESDSAFDYKCIIQSLDKVNCRAIMVFSFNKLDFNIYEKILESLEGSRVSSLEFVIAFDRKTYIKFLQKIEVLKRVKSIIFHGLRETEKNKFPSSRSRIFCISRKLKSVEDLNSISQEFFTVDRSLFIESIKYNTYYNKKLLIDKNGEIKKSYFDDKTYGNIHNCNLEKLASNENFTSLHKINKDLITVCKDCEFRRMCIDHRVPKQRVDNTWYFESDCDYNPYIAKWKHENGFKSLDDIGIKNNFKEFNINNLPF